MPSTLVSGYHPHTDRHHLPQLRDFNWNWDAVRAKTGQSEHLQKSMGYDSQCIITSPQLKMSENPGLNSGIPGGQYMNPPAVPSVAPPYPTPNTHSRHGSHGKPFYQSYYSARQNQSPPTKKENSVGRGEPARRRVSTDGNTIASYLQIPSSINDSKGSLPEFAAQVSLDWIFFTITQCLFYSDYVLVLVRIVSDPSACTRSQVVEHYTSTAQR